MGPLVSFVRRFAFVSLVALLTFTPAMARAGTEDPPDASAPAPEPPSPEHPRYRMLPVVVTPDRFPIRLDRVPADVTVISPERLEARRPLFMAEALRDAPGIDVQRSGSTGKLTDIRLRGADPRHTLVLYDGIPLNGPWLGIYDFADFMGAGQNQVEVFGGPASSLYGSGAVGGVIQIRSAPEGDAPRRSLFADYGEHATLRQGLTWDAPMGTGHAGVSLTRLTSEGQVARDGYTGLNGQLHVGIPVGSDRL
ncbi:MAG TPA: TonB-dependent receptor plug domain-containing protein, partial [Candidatus Angelobacter sp.]|nr:TonB-dependent receptor plug domain-containing protein [Candidatus Angelobacter sp.]